MLRPRVPLLALVGGGGVVSATASADGVATVSAQGSFTGPVSATASASGVATVSAVGASIASATATAAGTATVSAQGSSTSNIQSATAAASGTATVSAVGAATAAATALAEGSAQVSAQGSFIGVASTTASASGSATVSAQAKAVGGAPSVPTKMARWASYQRRSGTFIRQVSPGVYLRASKTEAPVVVVNDREIGPAENVRGDKLAGMLAQGLDKRDARKIRKILRRLEEPPDPVEVAPEPPPEPPKSAEAEKLIEEVNSSMPKPVRTTVTVDYCEEEIAIMAALRMF